MDNFYPHEEDYLAVAPAEELLFLELIHELPGRKGFGDNGFDKQGVAIPYGCGPHCIKVIKKVCEIVRPKAILEIGFNMGHSSAMWLHFSMATVVAVDISDKDETLSAAKHLSKNDRFEFILSDSATVYEKLKGKHFDAIFIDGDHLEEGVLNDINLGLKLGIKTFIFDDWLFKYGPGVQPAIARSPLQITHLLGNIAIASN